MVHTYAEYHSANGPLCGDRSVVILDGRWSLSRCVEEAKDHARTRLKGIDITHLRIGKGRFSDRRYVTELIAL